MLDCQYSMINQFAEYITVESIICLAGVLLFGTWLIRTSLGRNALADSEARQNTMPLHLPFIPLLVWFGVVPLAILITKKLLPDLPDWQGIFLDNCILCIGAIVTTAVIIFLAGANFAGRLKGFGLNVKTIHKDFFAAVINLVTAWPLVIFMIILTMHFGQLIWGKDFLIEQHEQLKTITAYPQLPVRILIIITTIAVVPVFEELLFRGLFQTMIRTFLEIRSSPASAVVNSPPQRLRFEIRGGPWLSILITSGLFAVFHQSAGHWPALFVLAVCLGYSYEKSGSLFRPIFIHTLFNTSSILTALYQ